MGKKKDRQREIELAKEQRRHDRETKKNLRKKQSKADAFKLGKEYNEYFRAFNNEIKGLHMRLKDVIGDGNCLFRSFADQIDGSEVSHIFMRDESCNYMLQHEEFFRPFLDEDEDGTLENYVKDMRKSGEWGGHLELQALSECFRSVIVVHKRGLEEVDVRPITQEARQIVHLAYFQHEDFEHYASVREMEDESMLPAIEGLKHVNNNLYGQRLAEHPEEYMLRMQMEELALIDKFEKEEEGEYEEEQVMKVEEEPYPGYPKNKKCKCGSGIEYKNCCYKEYQKRLARV